MSLLGLTHRTTYTYDRPVRLGPHVIRLRPMQGSPTPVSSYALHVTPEPLSTRWMSDPFGNPLARVVLPGPVERLEVVVDLVADLSPYNPFSFLLEPQAQEWPFVYTPEMADVLWQFRQHDYPGPLLQAVRDETRPGPTLDLVLGLAARVRDRIAYVKRTEPGVWNPDRTLAEGRGSCRDSAWLMVQILRLHGIAARFVSGYLLQEMEDGRDPVAELHAWPEAYLPGAGWFGVDATSGFAVSAGHVPLAATPTPTMAAPVVGTVEPCDSVLETEVSVRKVTPQGMPGVPS